MQGMVDGTNSIGILVVSPALEMLTQQTIKEE